MNLSEALVVRFHQTAVSRTLRSSRLARIPAEAWWHHYQSRRFAQAMHQLEPPAFANDEADETRPTVPSRGEVCQKMPPLVEAGERFSREMAQWCRTSKFLSITQEPGSCGYQDVYAQVLGHLRGRSPRILEIGIGINDPAAPSGMGSHHVPGASLSGWANYFPGAEVHGADVDRRCLVTSPYFTTHFVDQRDPASLARLARDIGGPLDLIVDDGLHTPEANANTVRALAPLLSDVGVLVIEDIQPRFDNLWEKAHQYVQPAYAYEFYPSRILRQDRESGGGLAVLTLQKDRLP